MSRDDNLFSRWSNRKRAVAEEDAASDLPADEPKSEAVAPQPEESAESEEEVLARFGLPSPESLGPGDDFSGFMQTGVPEFLRKRALRRLWRSNPVLACVDGLNDYDEDFTSPEETMKVLKTAYKVGRGFLKDPEEVVETVAVNDDADLGPSVAEEAADEASVAVADDTETVSPVTEDATVVTESQLPRTSDSSPDQSAAPAKKPRRMRFQS